MLCQEIPCIFLGNLLLCASLLKWALTQLLFVAAAGEQSYHRSFPSWVKLVILEGKLAFSENC